MKKIVQFIIPIILLLFLQTATFAQKEIIITTIPSDAELFKIEDSGIETSLGYGMATIRLQKEKETVLELRKTGFVTVKKKYLRTKEGSPTDTIELFQRKLTIIAYPPDAEIYINEQNKGRSPLKTTIGKGETYNVEVKKAGFISKLKPIQNKPSQENLDSIFTISLDERVVKINTKPNDATVFIDDKKMGEGNAQIIIPQNACVVVRAEKYGYVSNQVQYCNKETNTIPINDEIELKDWNLKLQIAPEDAKVIIDRKEVNYNNNFFVKIPNGSCKDLFVSKPAFVPEYRKICNDIDNVQQDANFPISSIRLDVDEAYQELESKDVNNKIDIAYSPTLPAVEAWKKVVKIVTAYFETTQAIDPTSYYLQTAWIPTRYNKNNILGSTVRTRVTIRSDAQVFHVNLQSEVSSTDYGCVVGNATDITSRKVSVNNDDCFVPFNKIVKKFSTFILEMQSELKTPLQAKTGIDSKAPNGIVKPEIPPTLVNTSANASDLILKTDRTEIKAKVLGVLGNDLTYKSLDLSDGTIYSVKIDQVFQVIYSDGRKEVPKATIAKTEESSPSKNSTQQSTNTGYDLIIKIDRSEIKANIFGREGDDIKYRNIEGQEGTISSINVAEVFMIVYSSGRKDYPKPIPTQRQVEITPTKSVKSDVVPDVLVKSDRSEIKALVVGIEEETIKYKKAENMDGPVYNIKKSAVMMIIYGNGRKEYFDSKPIAKESTESMAGGNTENMDLTPEKLTSLDQLEAGIYYYDEDDKQFIEIEGSNFTNQKSGALGENILNNMTHGITGSKVRAGISGKTSSTKLKKAKPIFFFVLDTKRKGFNSGRSSFLGEIDSPKDFLLLKMIQNGNSREIVTGKTSIITSNNGIDDESTLPFVTQKMKKGFYKVTLENNLSVGEYCFFLTVASLHGTTIRKIYDFSIK